MRMQKGKRPAIAELQGNIGPTGLQASATLPFPIVYAAIAGGFVLVYSILTTVGSGKLLIYGWLLSVSALRLLPLAALLTASIALALVLRATGFGSWTASLVTSLGDG